DNNQDVHLLVSVRPVGSRWLKELEGKAVRIAKVRGARATVDPGRDQRWFGREGNPLRGELTVRRVDVVDDKAEVAVSGEVGLAWRRLTRVTNIFEQLQQMIVTRDLEERHFETHPGEARYGR